MNSHIQSSRTKSTILAVALCLPLASALAQSAYLAKGDSTGQYGRDSVYVPQPPLVLIPPKEPQIYGRSGGYVGTDRVVAVDATLDRGSDVVKPGDSPIGDANVAETRPHVRPPIQSTQD